MTDWLAALLRSPQEHRRAQERRLREEPERVAQEGKKRVSLRFFLHSYSEVEPKLLEELRKMLSVEVNFLSRSSAREIKSLSDRFYLPPTITVANEMMLTLMMWQAFSHVPNLWHFELPEGAAANPFSPVAPSRPYPFVFAEDGWNPEVETYAQSKKRLRKQFQATLKKQSLLWEQAEMARSELRTIETFASAEQLTYLRCLAEKQATPNLSFGRLATDLGLEKETVRRAVGDAADMIELPRGKIRKAKPGRPSHRK